MNKDWEKGHSADLEGLDMDNKELHNLWLEGYNDGFRRAIEFVKKQSGHGDVELDRFLEELVEEMMNDWYKSCPDD